MPIRNMFSKMKKKQSPKITVSQETLRKLVKNGAIRGGKVIPLSKAEIEKLNYINAQKVEAKQAITTQLEWRAGVSAHVAVLKKEIAKLASPADFKILERAERNLRFRKGDRLTEANEYLTIIWDIARKSPKPNYSPQARKYISGNLFANYARNFILQVALPMETEKKFMENPMFKFLESNKQF